MKVSLAALYAGQKSFFAEYSRYSTDFLALGYSPEGSLKHKTGFLRPYNPKEATSPTEQSGRQILSTDELNDLYEREQGPNKLFSITPEAKKISLEMAARFCRNGCTADGEHFEIFAVANLDEDPDLDVWLIDETKTILHANDDLASESSK